MAGLPPDQETPASNAIAMFCVYMALRAHADKDGHVEIEAETDEDSDKVLADWANEFLDANKPLSDEEKGILHYMGVTSQLTPAEINGMMSLAEEGFGIMDIRTITITAPVARD
jgi:hypothetical protein